MTDAILGDQPSIVDLQFHVERALAIDAYASLEHSLSFWLSALLKNDPGAAISIFHRLSNTRSRIQILEDLMRLRVGEAYDTFLHGVPNSRHRRGLMNIIQALDGRRNEIVHWTVVRYVGDGPTRIVLRPPSFLVGSGEAQLEKDDLIEFTNKAAFAGKIVNMFQMFLWPEKAGDEAWRNAWRGIFQQPCVYPPEDSHPLSQNYKGPEVAP